ncbi:MAG: hypothetical protein CVU90_12150 [Firmicutes bacterium HGW-Firmicutes-15]|nr:MAG: hypothetical protein CVU90_12150 [Firmicutes bacterium HGW-Firmicutes-15]
MVIAGLLVATGALLNMLLFGFKVWGMLCLAAGAGAALMGSSVIRNKLYPASDGSMIRYNLIIAVVLAVIVLAAPVMFGNSSGPENLDRAIKKSASLVAVGDLDRAGKLLMDIDTKYPGVPEVQLNLSTVHLMQGRPEEAARVLESSKESRYYNANECFNYAMTYYQRGNYDDAMVYLKKALKQEPNIEDGCLYASECARRQGDYKAAQYYARRIVEMKPTLPLGHVQLARVELMVMEYHEAAAELEKALELKPDDSLKQEILRLKEEVGYYQSKL